MLMLCKSSYAKLTPRVLQYTPQQNGVVERKNRTLVTLIRTMLDEYNRLEALWAEAINTACYASNHLFLQKFLGKTPYELLNGKMMRT